MRAAHWQGRSTVRWPWEDTALRARLIGVAGESRGANHSEGTAVCYPPAEGSLSPDRVLMMSNPRAPGGPFEDDFFGPEAAALIPMRDCRFGNRALGWAGGSGDPLGHSLSACAYWLDRADALAGRPPRRTIFVVVGVGGRKSYEIVRGAPDWDGGFGPFSIYGRSLRMFTRARDLSRALHGQEVTMDAMIICQGFNDLRAPGAPTPATTWRDTIEANLIAAYDQDIPAITGQSTPPIYLFEQTPSGLAGEPNPVSLGQADMANRNLNGRTFLAMATYALPANTRDTDQSTTAHGTSRAVVIQGEMFGRAAEAAIAGTPLPRCRITGVARSGATVTLTANRPLVVDTASFPDPGQLGLVLRDGAGALVAGGIASAAVSGSSIVAQLGVSWQAAMTIEYAHERPGGRLGSGTAGVNFTDGEVDMAGDPAQTSGAYGVVRAADRAEASVYAPGYIIRDWLEIGQWAVPA
jgi:hypothetical protein